ncbi:AraC family transcriptional regulator [Pseudomaricurvus alkylphenolicus]|jgi:AraC-like DNA-binding protein|uniref:AraC family transcriptional regulator n=1 Tax=Pseudomaricurvus alkylphenolicus TaxID=1306991 RepID=UPI0014205061|nr:AraC family transcriptional regulator [Pseudomaricurvus alkylphenolicus]NIB38821.1 AraC family transcriptional regulator [Pseudomaricurvus alkylphenolicus]
MFRPTIIKHYLSWMEQQGFQPQQVLSDTGIEEHKLSDHSYLIDIWQSQKVIANMSALTGDDHLGFRIAEDIKMSDFGIMGYALMSARDMREVANLWTTYSHTLIGELIRIAVEEQEDGWRVVFTEVAPLGSLLRFCLEECLAYGKYIGEATTKNPFNFVSLTLAYPKPADTSSYAALFDCPISFNGDRTLMHIRSPGLNTPIEHNDSELHEVCLQHCQQVMRKITEERPLAFRIRHILLQRRSELPSLQQMADALHMSSRSLRRHLQAEGVSYQELLNQFRADLAQEYIRESGLSNQEIGFLLGYQDTKAFLRAFKSWTGQTVTDFRNQAAA